MFRLELINERPGLSYLCNIVFFYEQNTRNVTQDKDETSCPGPAMGLGILYIIEILVLPIILGAVDRGA